MRPSILPSFLFTIFLICSLFGSYPALAQDEGTKTPALNAHLKGLTLANGTDLADIEIQFDGKSFPVYDLKGKKLSPTEMMDALMSGDYTPEFYINKSKEIKAAVLRATTPEEQIRMLKMQAQMSGDSPLKGKEAPPFYSTDLDGNELSLQSLKGKVIVINFWFVECKPCVKEIPELNELVEKYKDKNVEFLAFATNKSDQLHQFLEEKAFNYHIIPDSKAVARAYLVSGYPTHVIIDQDSKIQYLTTGLGPTTVKSIEKNLEDLLNH
jgi:peroxiredoxin